MSEQPFVDCPICGNCSVRPEDAAEVERLREDLHNQQAQATEWAERFLRQRARAETAEGALRAVDENQRRQLEALGLLERFAPSSDLADDMGEALLTAERERDEYRTLAKQYRDDWQSEIDGNAALRRELGAHDNETFPAFARRLAGEATGYRELAAELARALATVQTLMQESRGVDGLHRNGDVADWDWLVDYDWMPDINSLLRREDVKALLREDGDGGH